MARQDRRENAPLSHLALNADSAALPFDDLFGQRQTKARPLMFLRGGGLELLKLDEQLVDVFRVDSLTGVLDFQTEKTGLRRYSSHGDASAFRSEFDCVGEIVIEHLL